MSNDVSRILKEARGQGRLATLEYVELIFDDFMELHGDRHFADDGAAVGGITRLDSRPVTVIDIQKGENLQENLKRSSGQSSPEGYRKALRLVKQAEKLGRPVVTSINIVGAYPGVDAEGRGQGEVIARNLLEMSDLKMLIITITIGKGGSGGVFALAVADRAWMLEHSMYAISSPEGFASILWKDGSRATETAELMKITAGELYNMGVVDRVVPEHGYFSNEIVEMIKTNLITELDGLSQLPLEQLLESRYQRFRKY